MSPRAVDKRARPGNEGSLATVEPAADLAEVVDVEFAEIVTEPLTAEKG
ncbi:hypothetical protein FB561_1709 [Kribbella amoyensis]|uniref:Uncharacterized protein n=1 Tax=Kribbella amoyensis TaxID=996641 RepID=A0A561BP31_9ACTN|nr:hypothetical protein [Kribbella amoyensis]TWD80624.1 hypothetical protein FB561_1709 [Kribbella amoyensis]